MFIENILSEDIRPLGVEPIPTFFSINTRLRRAGSMPLASDNIY